MKNDKLKYGIGGIFIGGFIVWFASTTIVNSNNAGMMGPRQVNQPNILQNAGMVDAHFIEQMIPHHEDAITMAKVAQVKSQKPEIRKLAESIIVSQGSEINQMKAWYKSWFGKEVPSGNNVMTQHGMRGGSGMHMGMMGSDTDMKRLENAEHFDKVFIEEMIPHHQMAVMMANMLKSSTQRDEMKKLADDIIKAQTDEIDQMRQWYMDWGFSL